MGALPRNALAEVEIRRRGEGFAAHIGFQPRNAPAPGHRSQVVLVVFETGRGQPVQALACPAG